MLKAFLFLGVCGVVSGSAISTITCTQSSTAYGLDFTCDKAIDGVLSTSYAIHPTVNPVGAFVTFQLIAERTVFGLRLMQRQGLAATDSNKDIKVDFSDGTSEVVTMTATEGVQEILFNKGHRTAWVKLTVESVYHDNLNGFAEVNVVTNPLTVTDASSVYSPSYAARFAADDTAAEWASMDGVGNWIQVALPSEGLVAGVYLRQRAGLSLNKDVEITFDDGSKQTVTVASHDDVQFFALSPAVQTTNMRIETTSVYGAVNNGWQEINVALGELNANIEAEAQALDAQVAAEEAKDAENTNANDCPGGWEVAIVGNDVYRCKGDQCEVNSGDNAFASASKPTGTSFVCADGFSGSSADGAAIVGSSTSLEMSKSNAKYVFPFECNCA